MVQNKTNSIASQRRFSKSNDLPIFVQLMIQKDKVAYRKRKELLKKQCTLEAQQLMALGSDNNDKVYVTFLPNHVGVQLNHPYEDSNPPKINDFEKQIIVSKNVPQEQSIKQSVGYKQLKEILS